MKSRSGLTEEIEERIRQHVAKKLPLSKLSKELRIRNSTVYHWARIMGLNYHVREMPANRELKKKPEDEVKYKSNIEGVEVHKAGTWSIIEKNRLFFIVQYGRLKKTVTDFGNGVSHIEKMLNSENKHQSV